MNRGCHWHKQHQRWRVVFRVDGKLKYFGQYETLEEAQARANEVWPSLPIAQRAVKKCDVCGVIKSTSKEFRHLRQICKACCLKRRKDAWWTWTCGAMYGCSKMRKAKQHQNVKCSWCAWAKKKQIVLYNRRSRSNAHQQSSCVTTWEQWCVYELKRFAREMHDQGMVQWKSKIKKWAIALTYRENGRLPEQNLGN